MKLRLGGHLSYYLPGRPTRLELKLDGQTRLVDLLAKLGVPAAEVGLAAVNGELVELEQAVLTDADTLEIHPPIGGGSGSFSF